MQPYEFWNPRLFEAPYYVALLMRCLLRGLAVKGLAKANYGLDHGELGLGSKFSTQMAFAQDHFLPTVRLDLPGDEASRVAAAFVASHGLPVILKPDIGAVGKGVIKIDAADALMQAIDDLEGTYLLQAFCPYDTEYGVFVVRSHGQCRVTGINKKHFPTVVGNGCNNIGELAALHPRYTLHWPLFLKYIDLQRVPNDGEATQLSFIGSHTMGCKFTDDTNQLTRAIERTIEQICADQPGFNFGRLDVKARDDEAFCAGDFVVIEVNGIASLPTHMFDPSNSLGRAYRIFLQHAKLLVDVACEHRHRQMALDSYADIWRQAVANQKQLDRMHAKALGMSGAS